MFDCSRDPILGLTLQLSLLRWGCTGIPPSPLSLALHSSLTAKFGPKPSLLLPTP